jgi:hypothetical protein
MTEPKLDWSSAEVSDSTLRVRVEGELPAGWRETFERTAALLGGNDWDEVKLKKERVQVGGIEAGSEEKLRHYLESVVQEANAAHTEDDSASDAGDPSSDGDDEDPESADGGERSPDAEMTDRFRSFAGTPPAT